MLGESRGFPGFGVGDRKIELKTLQFVYLLHDTATTTMNERTNQCLEIG